MTEKYLYYVLPETPKPKWEYKYGAVIAESAMAATEQGNISFGTGCKILSGPYKLNKEWYNGSK